MPTAAAEQDFQAAATVTPVGIFLPAQDELVVYGVPSNVTSAGLVDRLIQWWERVRARCAQSSSLVINRDKGPENHSRRPQFMYRLVTVAQHDGLTVRLAYSPPYPSKYHPSERWWGMLEQHGHGVWRDAIESVLAFAGTLTWKGRQPVVERVTTTYQTGVKLAKEAMDGVEIQLPRARELGKWFIDIVPAPGPG